MTNTVLHEQLCILLQNKPGTLYIALSGGIDSITLMTVAARVRKQPVIALHAVSAAVPELATQRCRELSAKYDWQLKEMLSELAALPAQPCLSSRVQTGIAINANDLRFIESVEAAITSMTQVGDIRCRITAAGVVVELPVNNPVFQVDQTRKDATSIVEELCLVQQKKFIGFQYYKMGSAFLRNTIEIQPDV